MYMSRDLITVSPTLTVAEAAGLMARKHVRRLLVTHSLPDGLRLLGLVSARDVLHAFPPEVNPFAVDTTVACISTTKVAEIMKSEVETTAPDTPLEQAALAMQAHKIGALPVLRNDRLVGIITESDIFRAFVSLFADEHSGARITFDASAGEDVFRLVSQLSQKHGMHLRTLVSTQQHQEEVCVVRVAGHRVDAFLDELWRSGHLVLNVVRYPTQCED